MRVGAAASGCVGERSAGLPSNSHGASDFGSQLEAHTHSYLQSPSFLQGVCPKPGTAGPLEKHLHPGLGRVIRSEHTRLMITVSTVVVRRRGKSPTEQRRHSSLSSAHAAGGCAGLTIWCRSSSWSSNGRVSSHAWGALHHPGESQPTRSAGTPLRTTRARSQLGATRWSRARPCLNCS